MQGGEWEHVSCYLMGETCTTSKEQGAGIVCVHTREQLHSVTDMLHGSAKSEVFMCAPWTCRVDSDDQIEWNSVVVRDATVGAVVRRLPAFNEEVSVAATMQQLRRAFACLLYSGTMMLSCSVGFLYGMQEVRVFDVLCQSRDGSLVLCFVCTSGRPRRPTDAMYAYARECVDACTRRLTGETCFGWILNVPESETMEIRRYNVHLGIQPDAGGHMVQASWPPRYTENGNESE
jgi:hypothetical protein